MKSLLYATILFIAATQNTLHAQINKDSTQTIVWISDLHFGTKKKFFINQNNVDAAIVNRVMANAINELPFPAIDAIFVTGDISNRMQPPLQAASKSWQEFEQIYLNGIQTHDQQKQKTPFYLSQGNHDISNAIGIYKKMQPAKDSAAYRGIYQYMHPNAPLQDRFSYSSADNNYSKNIGGVHFQFVNIFPDSVNLVWMEKDIQQIPSTMPVIIVTHDNISGDPHHFSYDSTLGQGNSKLENLLPEMVKGNTDENANQLLKRQEELLDAYLLQHQNVKLYLHGHNNYAEYYTHPIAKSGRSLPVLRVDSPMKGEKSKKDEKLLSFWILKVNSHLFDAQEYFWNTNTWGQHYQIAY